jgi:hypothetical protein
MSLSFLARGAALVRSVWVLLVPVVAPASPALAAVDFNRDIRPILSRHCSSCHGGVKQAGGVSFIHRDLALGRGKSGRPTVVSGQPEASELVRRIRLPAGDEDRMPPADHGDGKPLTAAEVSTLRQWIADGAPWGLHWSFLKPVSTAVPQVKDTSWATVPLDRFILARLEHEGLQPSAPADPAQWLRRATFDLTGLPPSPEELERFTRGAETSAQAVDRLLASPRFGERWAAPWLDLARYADTQGYEKDNGRDAWPWRDWLVRSLNADMPYDQFTLKVLAGDLLPEAGLEDRIATGFHRNTQTNTEGGTDDEEFRLNAVIDRVNTTWTVWQGTTFGCVQCHSHPYEPFRHDEYYRVLSMWNSTEDADLSDDFPRLKVPKDPARFAEAEALDRRIGRLRTELNDAALPLVREERWTPLAGLKIQGPAEATFQVEGSEVRVGGTVPNGATYVMTLPPEAAWSALRLDIQPRGSDPKQWPEHGAVVGHLWMELEDPAQVAAAKVEAGRVRAENEAMAAADAKAIDEATKAGREVPKKRQPKPLPTGLERIEFTAVYADTLSGPYDPEESLKPGAAGGGAFPKLFGPRWLVFVPKSPVRVGPGQTLRLHLKHEIFDAETKGSILHHFALSTSGRGSWTGLVNGDARADLRRRLDEARAQRDAIPSVSTLVMRERPPEARRETRVFVRGNFMAKDKTVEPGVPALLPPMPAGAADRLAAARWLVSPENPLTARVAVNRVWAEVFGVGIVETVEDFGSTGLPPSHPELLDALALRFQGELGWSLKALLREIVLSSTYRQDHRADARRLAADPRNRLLSRGPRTRLAAEMIRDQALAVSGLLSGKMGGGPVMPLQPEGVWQVVYNGSQWVTPQNEDRHRRSLYTYWRRTSPYPSFVTFDASSREMCTPRRVTTSTPLQALVTLNDPVYAEAALALARRMQAHGTGLRDQLAWAWRAVTSEPAAPATLARLERLHAEAQARYAAETALTAPVGGEPRIAALSLVASTLLNLDEALTK